MRSDSTINQNAIKYRGSLHIHMPHPHISRNANERHKGEQAQGGFNTKLALALTRSVGTMFCAYVFFALALLGLPNLLSPVVAQWVTWTSQTCIQLTMLSVIMVGQGLIGRKAELQADETYKFSENSYHDIEQMMVHLAAQDAELLKQTEMLLQLLQTQQPTPHTT